jgi:hypothetical protein
MHRDVFIQAFDHGSPVFLRHANVRALVAPFLLHMRTGVASVLMSDGGAEIWGYGDDGGLAVVGATGQEIWDLVVAIARGNAAAIIPVGGTPIVADAALIPGLPPEGRDQAVVVGSGAELIEALEAQGPYEPRVVAEGA